MLQSEYAHSVETEEELSQKEEELIRTQIRHFRKFAAHIILNGWDIDRNLNIIRMQLAWMIKYKNQKDFENNKCWIDWGKYISECNEVLQKDPDSSSIRPDINDDVNLQIYKSLLKKVFNSITGDKNCFLYKKENTIDERKFDDTETFKYYDKFKATWKNVPIWWNEQLKKTGDKTEYNFNYDHLLLDLALQYNLDPKKYQDSFKDHHIDRVGFTDFLDWIKDWRNIQHRLRCLTFVICKYLRQCKPYIEDLKIPRKYQVSKYNSYSIIFLNGYMHNVHVSNCIYGPEYKDVEMEDDGPIPYTYTMDLGNYKDLFNLSDEFDEKTVRLKDVTSCQHKEKLFVGGHKVDTKAEKSLDPFMTRDLNLELLQTFRSLDVHEFGYFMAESILIMCKDNPAPQLWKALEMLVAVLPYETTQYILEKHRPQFIHGSPMVLQNIGQSMLNSACSKVQICLFLAKYMQCNAKTDISRHETWMEYADEYENAATTFVDQIESDLLLSIYLTIPVLASGDTTESLLNVALKQRSAKFLNNQRIDSVLNHLWESASALNPHETIALQPMTARETLIELADQPFKFYLTPKGFDAASKTSHILYVIGIYFFIGQRVYLDDPLNWYECFLWLLNFGYISYEGIECYTKGLNDYFALSGWINIWDILISVIWIFLFIIRMCSAFLVGYDKFHYDVIALDEGGDEEYYQIENIEPNRWRVCQAYMILWSIQAASLSVRSLALFQTSQYFGVLLRIVVKLSQEMARFLVVLALLLLGYVFGLYYLKGGYLEDPEMSIADWYTEFKYLFELTLAMQEIPDTHFTIQLFIITYIIFGTVLLMNLLIALMTRTFEVVDADARTESAFARAEITYDLSLRSRFMPAPLCIFVFFIAIIVHMINIFPSLIFSRLNIYQYINHYQYQGFYDWKLSQNGCSIFRKCSKSYRKMKKKRKRNPAISFRASRSVAREIGIQKMTSVSHEELYINNKRKRDIFCLCCIQKKVVNDHDDKTEDGWIDELIEQDKYNLVTRKRTLRYYVSTICCCLQKYLSAHWFSQYHNSCYSSILTRRGAKQNPKDRDINSAHGITMTEYLTLHKKRLDPDDIKLLKKLTMDTLFCKVCYRPFDPRNLNEVLLTPFWALSELISIYLFILMLYIPLVIIYCFLALFEMCNGDNDEKPKAKHYDVQHEGREYTNSSNIW